MKQTSLALVALTLSATVVIAHGGVKNPAVMARMDGMSAIADNMKVLGGMAKGAVAFDAAKANEAAGVIAVEAARIPVLFQVEETDPKSEAKPEIWGDFGDFVAKANTLETAADGLSGSIQSADDLAAGMKSLGQSCQSCHETYRIKK
ncbi:c-type cytochrome [Shimia sediminis]|uniref:c-type cytochrome n=1 Tax=Shimia sediminis TaxID=2497945 RepID=UPI000F8CE534|nr:cytochrome c [Shimia sediminis]